MNISKLRMLMKYYVSSSLKYKAVWSVPSTEYYTMWKRNDIFTYLVLLNYWLYFKYVIDLYLSHRADICHVLIIPTNIISGVCIHFTFITLPTYMPRVSKWIDMYKMYLLSLCHTGYIIHLPYSVCYSNRAIVLVCRFCGCSFVTFPLFSDSHTIYILVVTVNYTFGDKRVLL